MLSNKHEKIIERSYVGTTTEEKVDEPIYLTKTELHPELSNWLSPIQTFKRTSTPIDRT